MKLKFGSWSLTPYLMVVLVVGLQACGGGGSSTPQTPAVNTSLASVARGYYEGFATINVPSGGDLTISDPNFKAIVDEKQFVITYVGTPKLLYKGTFTEVSDTAFKADIRVYKNQRFISTARIENGSIDAGASLKGTISAGTGDHANSVGDIELSYDNSNYLVKKEYKTGVPAVWGDTPLTGGVIFTSNTNINIQLSATNNDELNGCDTTTGFDTADVIYTQTGRIRSFTSVPMETCSDGTPPDGKVLRGYLTNYNGNGVDDDRMLFVASDDELAYVGILKCLNNDTNPIGQCFVP